MHKCANADQAKERTTMKWLYGISCGFPSFSIHHELNLVKDGVNLAHHLLNCSQHNIHDRKKPFRRTSQGARPKNLRFQIFEASGKVKVGQQYLQLYKHILCRTLIMSGERHILVSRIRETKAADRYSVFSFCYECLYWCTVGCSLCGRTTVRC